MQAIVTALDEPWRERVEEIWAELKAVFQLAAIATSTEPHFTYHAADGYDRAPIDAQLARLASTTPRFEVETHGLGVFHGEETVLFLHVTPAPALRAVHAAVWSAAEGIAADVRPVYAAETWVPHITLAIGDLRQEQLPDIMTLLARREYRWRMPATNLCLIPDVTSVEEPWIRWDLRERAL
jgi:2'-5' RNA ligase